MYVMYKYKTNNTYSLALKRVDLNGQNRTGHLLVILGGPDTNMKRFELFLRRVLTRNLYPI